MPLRMPVLAAVLLLMGCPALVTMTVERKAEAVIPACTPGQAPPPLVFAGFRGMDLLADDEMERQRVSWDDVRSVVPIQVSLRVSQGAQDLSHLRDVQLAAEALSLGRKAFASAQALPATGEAELNAPGIEILAHAKSGAMTVSTDVTYTRCPAEDQAVEATVVFELQVTGNPLERASTP
ncbi:MAG: hypothetical protein AB2A00_14575 [Myxococcota bacterium]